jgi:endonuclease/exonuclease/phosphatase family metal-dependent hydrolase
MTNRIVTLFICFFTVLFSQAGCPPVGLDKSTERKPLKIMSYNVRNCKGLDNIVDYKRVSDIINRVNADIVALQELDSATERSHKIVVLQELAKQTKMIPTFRASISYQGGKYGIGILTKEKPLKTEEIPLPGKEEKRSLLVVELAHFVICCTHWSLTREDRIASVELINKIAGKYSKPVFLTGDLNAEPGSAEIKNLEQDWQIMNDSKQPTIPANDPKKCIDFILAKKDLKYEFKRIKSVVENEPVASDHLPVWVEIRIIKSVPK